ncbi:MAG TPA: hypothetical protein VIE44_02610 [Methylomirabilota bacterium]|jgi:hypothetical protein
MTVLANALSLVLACVVGVGPIALVAILQNHRDRRAQALLHDVARQLSPDALRSEVALDVRCRLLSRGATVRLDLGRASSSYIWETAARLREGLPSSVRLEVDGRVDGRLAVPRPVRITVESPEPEPLRRAA